MSIQFSVVLPLDRSGPGTLSVFSDIGIPVLGPFQCLGTAALGVAAAAGNPNRDQNMNFGHTPSGGYDVTGTLPDANQGEILAYGPYARFMLKGRSGSALIRQANIDANYTGRDLRVHGGRSELNPNGLMPTFGCVRMFDQDVKSILDYINVNGITYPFPMVVQDGTPSSITATLVSAVNLQDPDGAA